jgi:hypothetical protein
MVEEKKDELKKEETPSGEVQPEKKSEVETPGGQPPEKDEVSNEELQKQLDAKNAELKKVESDRDNYRTGLLSAKAKKVVLSPELQEERKPYKPKPEVEEGEEEKTLRRTNEIARKQAENVMYEQNRAGILKNEQVATRKFMDKFPETTDEALMGAIVDEYSAKNGKSVEGVQMDLERAYTLVRIDRGIPLNPEPNKAREAEVRLSNTPTGEGADAEKPVEQNAFDQQAIKAMKEMGIEDASPKNLAALKKRIDEGTLTLPDNVLDKLFNG